MKTKQSLYAITVILILGIGLNNCTKKSDIIKYGQISGKVKSSATGEPISGAGLSLSPSNSSTTTGSDGAYSFVELEPQQYSIQVIKDGYQTNTTSVEVVAGENRLGDILITPAQPVLSVSTTLLDFGTDKSILPFEIRNNGAAPLIWNVAGDKPWISINPASGTTSAAGVNSVNITVDRSLLGKTSYAGTVSITSNGGSASISITVNVVNPVLYVSTTLLDFGSEQSILPFEIKNNGASELIWSITSDKPWLTVNPASGNVTTGTNAINASIDRSQIGKSTYVGTLVVNSNGGTATINVTVNVNGPLMNITPSSLVFGATDTEKTLQISNIGIGNLTYNAQTTQSWISFQNGSGSTTTEIKLMPVIVNRQGLSPGDYSGTIVINSNANNITLNISMIVAAPAAPQLTIGTVSNISSSSADIS
ncbi:MAG: BACON domain-containing protein, partial [Bacteroidales bacterium]